MSTLPQTPLAPTSSPRVVGRAYMHRIERTARALRMRAGLTAECPFDPLIIASSFGARIAYPEGVEGLTPDVRARLAALDASVWSGGGTPLPDGTILVLLNPNQTTERARVTLLEEVAHVHYGHQPTRLIFNGAGVPQREFDPDTEREAYWTAAAVLIPAIAIARAVYAFRTAAEVASAFGVSAELVEMRIKTLSLWPAYRTATRQ